MIQNGQGVLGVLLPGRQHQAHLGPAAPGWSIKTNACCEIATAVSEQLRSDRVPDLQTFPPMPEQPGHSINMNAEQHPELLSREMQCSLRAPSNGLMGVGRANCSDGVSDTTRISGDLACRRLQVMCIGLANLLNIRFSFSFQPSPAQPGPMCEVAAASHPDYLVSGEETTKEFDDQQRDRPLAQRGTKKVVSPMHG